MAEPGPPTLPENPPAHPAAGVCAAAVAILGAAGLLGWYLELPLLRSLQAGLARMTGNTAICFLASGAALWLLRRRRGDPLGTTLATGAGLLAALTLLEYALGRELGVDQLFLVDPAAGAGGSPGRMSAATAASFVLTSSALLTLDAKRHALPLATSLAAASLAFVALTSYAYDVRSLSSIEPFSSMAVHTALAFLLLSIGLLFARTDLGLAQLALAQGTGPALLRRLLPWAVGIPFMTGWLCVLGEQAGLYPSEFGTAVLTLSNITLLTAALVWNAQSVSAAAAELARASERDRLFAAVVESTRDAVVIQTPDGTITGWNPAAERLYGYSAAEAVGQSVDLLIPPGRSSEARDALERVRRGENVAPWDTQHATRTGMLVDVSVGLSPVPNAGGEAVAVARIARDVTEQRQAEQRFHIAVEACPSGMLMVDARGTIVLANTETERLFGYTKEELLGSSVERLVPERFRDGHRDLRTGFAEHPAARPMGAGRELHGLRKDGSVFPLEIGLNPVPTPGGVLVLGSIVDITERKRQNDELRRSNAELEQFAYVASHDLQEPLRMVASFTELLRQRYEGRLDEKADKYIHFAVDGAKRMQRLVADLLAYSRVGSQGKPFAPVRSEAVLANVLKALQSSIDESGATIEVTTPLPAVLADEGQLHQLFQNLIGNAIKFRSEAPPRIRIAAQRADEQWQFEVNDNGIGIDPRYGERVFGMFQRLNERDRYEGSGIGLAVAKRIVERHGGTIGFTSEPGEGARFFFTLDRAPAESEP